MFCSNCGKEIKEGQLFCPECGNKTVNDNDSNIVKPVTSKKNGVKKNTSKNKLIIPAIIIIAVVLAIVSLMPGKKNDNTFSNNNTPEKKEISEYINYSEEEFLKEFGLEKNEDHFYMENEEAPFWLIVDGEKAVSLHDYAKGHSRFTMFGISVTDNFEDAIKKIKSSNEFTDLLDYEEGLYDSYMCKNNKTGNILSISKAYDNSGTIGSISYGTDGSDIESMPEEEKFDDFEPGFDEGDGSLYGVVVDAPDGYVNLRVGPSTAEGIICEINNGETLAVYQEEGQWLNVGYETYMGWVAASQVSRQDTMSNTRVDENIIAGDYYCEDAMPPTNLYIEMIDEVMNDYIASYSFTIPRAGIENTGLIIRSSENSFRLYDDQDEHYADITVLNPTPGEVVLEYKDTDGYIYTFVMA